MLGLVILASGIGLLFLSEVLQGLVYVSVDV
jgi:hypothetical protein